LLDALCDHADFAKTAETSATLGTLFDQLVLTINRHNNGWIKTQIDLPASPFCGLLRDLNESRWQ
jgi:regulation of enolase protein 1 (concanavalin A-like superfamily)